MQVQQGYDRLMMSAIPVEELLEEYSIILGQLSRNIECHFSITRGGSLVKFSFVGISLGGGDVHSTAEVGGYDDNDRHCEPHTGWEFSEH